MSVCVAGRATAPWCGDLGALGEAWRPSPDGGVVCDAPGVYAANGAIRFVLPRCYGARLPEGPLALRAALHLVRALARYRRHPHRRAVDEVAGETTLRELGAVDDAVGWLEVALLLAHDVQSHGSLYVATTQVSPRRQGRVHWAKTQQRAFHVVDGPNVMTSPMWRSRHTIHPEDPLTQLHADTCASIRRLLGRSGVEGARRWTAREALSVLNARDHALYADRHRRVARWLRQYWSAAAGASGARREGLTALFAPKFPFVWEAMLREVMGGRPLALPSGTYRLGTGVQAGIRLIPDFVVQARGRTLVVDAKHYDLERLPGTESLAKQLLYRWLASRESGHGDAPLDDLVSVFVAPTVGHPAVQVLGAHELDGESAAARAFGRVWVVALDFETAADAYASERPWPEPIGALLDAGA